MRFLADGGMRKFPHRGAARPMGHVHWEGDLHFGPSPLSTATSGGLDEPLKESSSENHRLEISNAQPRNNMWASMCCILFGIFLEMMLTSYVLS